MHKISGIGKLLLEAYKEWVRDRAHGLAPSLAYYQLLSVAPVVGFFLFVSRKVLGETHMYQDVIPLLKSIFTPQLTKVIILLLSEKGIKEADLSTMSLLSGILLIWAGKGYFGQVKQTVEITWNKRQDSFGIRAYFLRMIATARIAFIAVVILVIFVFIRSLLPHPYIDQQGASEAIHPYIIKSGHWIFGFLVLTTLRIFYFTYIPPVKVAWWNAIPGAVLGAILLLIGREIMESHFDERPDADAAESIVMVLLWFYYSGLVFIYASEFSKLYIADKQNIDLKSLHFPVK